MNLNNLVSVIGGLAFFLFGMTVLSDGLKKVAGDKLESTLKKMTDYPMKGLLFGAVITIAMQSSSALTVMLVGLVNSGIMSLNQTVGIIMGSNIGTTLTAWILSLSGVKTDNILLLLLKPEYFSPILALIGIFFVMSAKEQHRKNLGFVLVGFAVLMHGMEWMSDSLAPLVEMPEFTSILTAFHNPFLGVLIGMAFTGVIQSSAASVGVLQALSLTGYISYSVAIPIIMGQNIGTCVTALLSSLGVSKNAKRVSVIHVSFNVIGTTLGMLVYLVCSQAMHLPIMEQSITPFAIAAFHTVFNVATTLVLLPFSKHLVSLAKHLIKDEAEETEFLDKRLLLSPPVAITECRKKTGVVLEHACAGVESAMHLLDSFSQAMQEDIRVQEEKVDEMVESCNQFLILLSAEEVSRKESTSIASMLHVLGDMERISDYSLNLSSTAKKVNRESFARREETKHLLSPIKKDLQTILYLTKTAYKDSNQVAARMLLEKADQLVIQIKALKESNLQSLQKGSDAASVEASVYLTDYLTVCRRITEHCQNVGEGVILS